MNPPCGIAAHLNAGISAIESPNGNICGLTFIPCFTLRNYGDDTLKSALMSYSIDNISSWQYQWNGFLPGGAEEIVCLPSITVTTGAHTFSIIVTEPNGPGNTNTNNTTNTLGQASWPIPLRVVLAL